MRGRRKRWYRRRHACWRWPSKQPHVVRHLVLELARIRSPCCHGKTIQCTYSIDRFPASCRHCDNSEPDCFLVLAAFIFMPRFMPVYVCLRYPVRCCYTHVLLSPPVFVLCCVSAYGSVWVRVGEKTGNEKTKTAPFSINF